MGNSSSLIFDPHWCCFKIIRQDLIILVVEDSPILEVHTAMVRLMGYEPH